MVKLDDQSFQQNIVLSEIVIVKVINDFSIEFRSIRYSYWVEQTEALDLVEE